VIASPTVSIILSVYNGGRFIESALTNVRGQTLLDWQLIVVEDGSTDQTAAILANTPSDARLQIIRQRNMGLAAARNRGISAASANYLAFIDVDDRWHPTYLQQMCAALDQAPSAVAAFAGWRYMDDAGRPLPQTALLSPSQAAKLATDLYWRNAILPSAVVARRDAVLKAGGFDESLDACEDWDLWLRLVALGHFEPVPHILMEYRVHDSSMTDNVDHIEHERLKLNAKHLGPLDEPLSAWPHGRRRAVGYTYFNSTLGHLRHKELARAREKIELAVRHWPGLLRQDEFYYELGCAFQQRGVRGTKVGLNLADGEALIRSVIFEWLSTGLTSASQSKAWSQANVVLARLARATGQAQAARRYASRAIWLGGGRQRWRALRTWARTYWRR
jgi:glycosyltransferase involved in cell wall biosynthesis